MREGYEQLLQRWGCDVWAWDGGRKHGKIGVTSRHADRRRGIAGDEWAGLLAARPGTHDVPAILYRKGSEERAVAAIERAASVHREAVEGPYCGALLDRALGKARDARQLAVLQRQLPKRDGWATSSAGRSRAEVMRMWRWPTELGVGADSRRNGVVARRCGAQTLHKLSPAPTDRLWPSMFGDPGDADGEEIFGHVRGAFTGASERRIGCFEWRTEHTTAGRNRRDAGSDAGKTFARSETARCGGWGARARLRWTCAFWQRRTKNLSSRE